MKGTRRRSKIQKRAKRRGKRKITRRRLLRGGAESPQHPSKEILRLIDHVVYINLDSRTDRKSEIEGELSIFPSAQVTRVPGIKDANGNRGATKSHLAAVEQAISAGWKNVLILEDDAMWQNPVEGLADLKRLVAEPYDVIVLGGFYPKFDPATHKLHYALGASSYLVNASYMPTLRDAYRELLDTFEANPGRPASDVAPDAHNPKLQKRDNWFIVNPPLMIQRKSRSNVSGGEVDYGGLFVLPNPAA